MSAPSSLGTNRTLVLTLVAVVVVVALIFLLRPSAPSELRRVDHEKAFTLEARLEPVWERSNSASDAPVASAGDDILIYVDTSHSMAGFLPPEETGAKPEATTLRTLAQLVPGHVLQDGAGRVFWYRVDEAITGPATSSPPFVQSSFRGSRSDLEEAVRQGIRALGEGEARSVVLISDLVATGDAKGAMGLGAPLVEWTNSAEVQQGAYDIGVLGARLPFWGAVTARCAAEPGLGCWYSEHLDRYLPLTEIVERPLYVLVLGANRGGRHENAAESAVARFGESLRSELAGLDVEVLWELLTTDSRPSSASLSCTAQKAKGGGPQFALLRDENGTFACRRDEDVILECTAAEIGRTTADSALSIEEAKASWLEVGARADAGRLVATVDCAALRETTPTVDLHFAPLVVARTGGTATDWRSWSSASDELKDHLGGTLQLDLFLDSVRLRPPSYRLKLLQPVLRPSSTGRTDRDQAKPAVAASTLMREGSM